MKVTILTRTTPDPLQCIGELAGICWGSDIRSPEKNIKRALDCIESGHGRVLELPDIYMVIEGVSAKVAREFYTHIGGSPTRLQESTRYIDYPDYTAVEPFSVSKLGEKDRNTWHDTLDYIKGSMELLEGKVPNEDLTNLLPLAYCTKFIVKMNLRTFSEMCSQRLCSRAYWEYQMLMRCILTELKHYSPEWQQLMTVTDLCKVKCQKLGYCPEKHSCGAVIPKAEAMKVLRSYGIGKDVNEDEYLPF